MDRFGKIPERCVENNVKICNRLNVQYEKRRLVPFAGGRGPWSYNSGLDLVGDNEEIEDSELFP
jgi:hypothetical protein